LAFFQITVVNIFLKLSYDNFCLELNFAMSYFDN